MKSVMVCADHDANGVGPQAALDTKARWVREGREVRLRVPRNVGQDFNDILRTR